jgi:hypothetical protein
MRRGDLAVGAGREGDRLAPDHQRVDRAAGQEGGEVRRTGRVPDPAEPAAAPDVPPILIPTATA